MSIEATLLEQLRRLSPDQQVAVLEYAQNLAAQSPSIINKPGLHQSISYWIADDFNDPLPHQFSLGQE